MSRQLLHISKLEPFKQWLINEGIGFRPGKGDYQVLQVLTEKGWQCVFSKNEMPEHYTSNKYLDPLIRKFIEDSK